MKTKILYSVIFVLGLYSCSEDPQGTSKVSGRVIDSGATRAELSQETRSFESYTGVEAATVIIAEVQDNGSLKTVSTQAVETDVNGNFVVETNMSGVSNLVVVANKGVSEWQAVVSAEVRSGQTVYSQPLNTESTTEAEVFARLKATGKANIVSQSDVQLYLNSEIAAQIKGNTTLIDQFINSLEKRSQASIHASSNANFGFSSSQIQSIAESRAFAQVSLETSLYNSSEVTSANTAFINYQKAIIAAYTNANVNVDTYARITSIASKAYLNACFGMSSQFYFECVKSEYINDAFVLQQAIEAKFKSAGATSQQSNAVVSAGTSLTTSIKNSISIIQIANAFSEYHSSIINQLKLTMNTHITAINTIDAGINGVSGLKISLNAAIGVGVSTNSIVNAYVSFYDSVKTLVQSSLTGASSSQVSAVAEILILANIYN